MRLFFAFSAILALSAPAFAGGYAAPDTTAVVPIAPAPAGQDWTGFYGGVQVETIFGDRTQNTTVAEFDGQLFGVFAGYRYDLGNFVVGGEVDYVMGSGAMDFSAGIFAPGSFDVEYNSLLRVGAEVGYDMGNVLAYGTVGFAEMNLAVGGSADIDGSALFYGIGVDYRINDTIIVGGELLQHDFEDFGDAAGNTYDMLTLGVGVAFTF